MGGLSIFSQLESTEGTEHYVRPSWGVSGVFMCSEMVPVQWKKIDDVFGHTLSNNDKRSLQL